MKNEHVALLAAVLTSLRRDSGQTVSYPTATPAPEENVLGIADKYYEWLRKKSR